MDLKKSKNTIKRTNKCTKKLKIKIWHTSCLNLVDALYQLTNLISIFFYTIRLQGKLYKLIALKGHDTCDNTKIVFYIFVIIGILAYLCMTCYSIWFGIWIWIPCHSYTFYTLMMITKEYVLILYVYGW